MRTILFIFITTLSFTLSKAQWVEINPGVDNALNDIYAITPDIAVAVGANGVIIKTSDGGETWEQKDSGTTELLRKVRFPSADTGYIVSIGNDFLKTIDGGETWNPINAGTNCFYSNLSCVDENLVFVTCSGTLLKSTDGGENWNEMGGIFGKDFQFVTDNIGYLASDDGFFKTENGGETWVEIDSYSFHPFYFIDKNLGLGVYGPLFKTMDGGNTFTQIGGSEIEYDGNIFAVNENIIWGFLPRLLNGDGSTTGIIKVFKDNEGDYIEELWYEDDPTLDMTSIHFADENTGYIVGYKNWKTRIWKNSTGINTMGIAEPTAINEIKVYPNPASEEINILFKKPFSGVVSLYDLTGKQVYSSNLIKKNNAHINVEKLAKGTYILLVKEKENTQTRKIIIN